MSGQLAGAAGATGTEGAQPPAGQQPAGGQGQQPAGGQPQAVAGQQPGGFYRPQGMPDEFAGETVEKTMDKLFAGYKGARDEMAKRGPVPKDAAGYVFDAPPELKPFFGNADDPALKSAQAAAAKHGISLAQFQGFVADTYLPLVKAGQIAAPYDPKAELDIVAKAMPGKTPADVAKAANDAYAFAGGLAEQLKLSPEARTTLEVLADTGHGVIILNAIRERLGAGGPQLGGEAAAGGAWTKEDLKKLSADPRIDPSSSKYDAAFRKQYDEAYRRAYGG